MRLIGRILAIVLVLIVPLLLIAASCNLALYNTMSNVETYRDAFADRALLDDIRPFAIPALFDAVGVQPETYAGGLSMGAVIEAIDMKNWETVMEEAVSAAWMKDRFDQLLRLFTGILGDDYSTLDESVDIETVQAQLQGGNQQVIANKIMSFAPACSVDQEEQLKTFEATTTGTFPVCLASDEDLQAFSASYVAGWVESLSTQMEMVTTSQFYSLESSDARGLHIILKLDEQMSYVSYLCPGALLALIVFLTVRSFRSFARWIGGSILFSGIGVLIALIVIQIVFVNLFSEATKSLTRNENEQLFTQVLLSLMRAGMGGISQSMLLQAGLMILAGFGLFALTIVLRRADLIPTGATVLVTEDGQVISSTSLPQIPVEPGSTSRRTASSQLRNRSDDAPLSS